MSEKNKIIVNILGKDYTLISDDSVDHMKMVSEFVKDKITDIRNKNRNLNSTMLAVLSALNVADEYFKILEYNKELEKRVNNPSYELQIIRDKLNEITYEFEEKNRLYDKFMTEFSALFESSSTYEEGIDELRDKIDTLQDQIDKKEKELQESDKKIEQLKEKLTKKDDQLIESKKELDDFIREFDSDQSN